MLYITRDNSHSCSPIESLIQFGVSDFIKSILPSTYNARQMIAQEVALVRVRQEEEAIARRFKDNKMLEEANAKRRLVKRDVDLTNMMAAGREKAKKEVVSMSDN